MLMSCSLVNGIWCSIFKMQFKISFELKSLVYGVLGRSFIKHSLYLLIVFSEHNFTSLHSTWCWLVFLLLVSLSTLGQPSGGSCVLYVFFRFFFFSWKGQTLNWNSNAWLIKFSGKFKKNMRRFSFSFSSLECDLWHFNSNRKKNWLKCVYFTLYVPYNEKEQEIFLVMKVCLLYHWQQIIRTWW